MKTSKSESVSKQFLQLFKDIGFEVIGRTVYVPNKSTVNYIRLSNLEDYAFMFNQLTRFTLSFQNINLIYVRYGLQTGIACTLDKCGEIFGVSDECIRTRIKTSFRKIKHSVNVKSTLMRLSLSDRGKKLIESSKEKI